jgi:acyl-CoA thioesterase-1
MEGPTNLGSDYRDAFRQVYMNLLREYQGRIAFVPFLLEGVAGNPALNQTDGIHPNVEGSKIIAQLLYPKVRDLVDRAGGGD